MLENEDVKAKLYGKTYVLRKGYVKMRKRNKCSIVEELTAVLVAAAVLVLVLALVVVAIKRKTKS